MSLKELRKAAGLTQQQAADLFGLKRRTFQNYENQVTSPEMDMAAQMARYFKCSIGDLFDLEEGVIRYEVSESDLELLTKYHQLDEEGKKRVLGYIEALIQSE